MKKFILIFLVTIFMILNVHANNLTISNIGETGFNNINNEFTSKSLVILNINYSASATYCRYINYEENTIAPLQTDTNWSSYEECYDEKFWDLSSETGNKTVYLQINLSSGGVVLFNDSIYYNKTGSGLDITYPSKVDITLDDYINDPSSIRSSWSESYDFESIKILKIPILYKYYLYNSSTDLKRSGFTYNTSKLFTNLSLRHNESLYVNVTAVNSAGLENNSKSSFIVVDLESPLQPTIDYAIFKNLSTGTWQDIQEGQWINALEFYFNWTGSDDLSYVNAYSYILDIFKNTLPDNIPEGSSGNYDEQFENYILNPGTGNYYFKVKSRDAAGNWGNNTRFNLKVDNSYPTKPKIISTVLNATGKKLNFRWISSNDEESGIIGYMINISNNHTSYTGSFTTNSTTTEYEFGLFEDEDKEVYSAIVGAQNGVGLWRWSNDKEAISDTKPPEILFKKPQGNIISTNPLISIWTDEVAECMYHQSGQPDIYMQYTNTTYHESKLTLSPNSYVYIINCTDPSGNSGSSSISFTISPLSAPDEIGVSFINSVYKDMVTQMVLNLNMSGSGLGEVQKEDIDISLGDNNLEYYMTDNGNGYYNISFIPKVDQGEYDFNISAVGLSLSTSLQVTELRQNIIFESDKEMGTEQETKIIYNLSSDGVKGASSQDEGLMFGEYLDGFNISVPMGKEMFIFFTKTQRQLKKVNRQISKNEFLDLSNPTFGYVQDENYYIYYRLLYDDIEITTDTEFSYMSGQYRFIIMNVGSDESDKGIFISSNIEENEKKIYKYG